MHEELLGGRELIAAEGDPTGGTAPRRVSRWSPPALALDEKRK